METINQIEAELRRKIGLSFVQSRQLAEVAIKYWQGEYDEDIRQPEED